MNWQMSNARADFYAFLSRMYAEEPPRELADDIACGKFPLPESTYCNRDFEEGVRLLEGFMEQEKASAKLYESLCAEYTRLFIGPVPALYPYESKYVDGSIMSKSLLNVKKEYRRAGLSKAEAFHEPEDHIAVELGFMSCLCRDQSKGSLLMQSEFLYGHILKWVPAFCGELCEKSGNDFYKSIAKLTGGFLIIEQDVLGELHGANDNGKDYIIKNSTDN